MQFFQHRFPKVEDYLHHRAPYLLVDQIVEIKETSITTEHSFSGDEFFVPGHFPGAAIFPGALMQELTTQSAGILIAANFNPMRQFSTDDPLFNELALGVLVRVEQAKYSGFARPGDTLRVDVTLKDHLESVFDFAATINVDGTPIMEIAFRLANIESKRLGQP